MTIDACYQLGYVIKRHGKRGEVSLFLDVDYPEEYKELGSVFVEINEKPIPFFIEAIRVPGQKAVVKFEGVDTPEEADKLRTKKVYLPLSTLPEREKGFYYHEIIGYRVIDKDLGDVGTVVNVSGQNVQDILIINHHNTEVLVPMHDEIVLSADRPSGTLHVNLPGGLLEVYLNP